MILKADCCAYKKFTLCIVFSVLFFLFSRAIVTAYPTLSNGILYINPSEPVPINGTVLDYYSGSTTILYVAKDNNAIVAGCYLPQEKKITQQVVARYLENTHIVRIAFESNAVYICIHEGDNSLLYRCDINTGLSRMQHGVVDFLLLEDGIVAIKSDNTLVYNDAIMPLHFLNKPVIKGHIDNRIIFISDGNDTEVVDIKTHKLVYRYANTVQYAFNSDYTIEIAINDIPGKEKASRVFYKIYCDGQYYGRTEPALSINVSLIQMNIAAGQYHEIIIERWRLDDANNQYVRDNNIRQPRPITVFIYPGRIILFSLVYDGTEYKVTSGFKVLEK